MQRFMLGLVVTACAMGAMGVATAGDGKSDASPPPKPVTVYEPRDSSCGCDKGFFHPLTKFWVRTVGAPMSDGMKSGARHVKHGIGGGGD